MSLFFTVGSSPFSRSLKTLRIRAMIAFAALCGVTASIHADPGDLVWKFELSNISGAFITVADDGTIYTVDKDRMYALDPSGTIKWTFEDAGGAGGMATAGGGRPVAILPDGRLVVASGHTIWALDTAGTVQWTFNWDGGFNNQIDNGPSVGPDGNIYATTAINNGFGMGVFSLTPNGELRWQDDADPPLFIINASHGQRMRFTDTRMIFGFMNTTGGPLVYAYDFDGDQTNLINYTCNSSPHSNSTHLLMAGACGVQAIDLDSDTIEWNVNFGAVNNLPIPGSDGVVYSGKWHGAASAISPQGQVLWTSPADVSVQRTLAVNDQHGVFLYAGENFGAPNWLGGIDSATGEPLWQLPFETINGHNELSWSNEAAFSPDGTVAYFTTRFTSNGTSGRLWAVRIAGTDGPMGDLDGDGHVGFSDISRMLNDWGQCAGPCMPDLDNDEQVGFTDLNLLLMNWG